MTLRLVAVLSALAIRPAMLQPEPTALPEVVAVLYVRSHQLSGDSLIAFSGRKVLRELRGGTEARHALAMTTTVNERLRTTNRQAVAVSGCGADPDATCLLSKGAVSMAVSDARVTGQSADVVVDVDSSHGGRTDARSIHSRQFTVRLIREGATWRVVSAFLSGES